MGKLFRPLARILSLCYQLRKTALVGRNKRSPGISTHHSTILKRHLALPAYSTLDPVGLLHRPSYLLEGGLVHQQVLDLNDAQQEDW